MKVAQFSNCVSAIALVTALAAAAPALAQQAPAAPQEADGLEVVIVTASGGNRTQINSSVSVTTVNAQAIADFKPSSESELLRMIPGIQVSGTAGPGGNSAPGGECAQRRHTARAAVARRVAAPAGARHECRAQHARGIRQADPRGLRAVGKSRETFRSQGGLTKVVA